MPFRLILLFFILTLHLANGQKKNFSFVHIGKEQGLSQTYIKTIYQDSRGFMWFGTGNDGVNKYDGYKFSYYKNDPDNKYSLSNNHVNQILEDSKGNIWMATENGLAKFDRNTEKFITYNHIPDDSTTLSDKSVNTILEDSKGDLWIGTQIRSNLLGGLNLFDPKTNTFSHYLPGIAVSAIIEDHDKNLWIGSLRNGVFLYNRKEKRFTNFSHNKNDKTSISSNNVYKIFEDSYHNIWVATRDAGLNKLEKNKSTFKHYRKGPDLSKQLGSDAVLSLAEDSDGFLWIGTENGGVSLLNLSNDKMYRYTNEPGNLSSVSGNSFHALYKDEQGNMWLSALGAGIDLLNKDGDKFIFYRQTTPEKGTSNFGVFSIAEDYNGNILLGTDGGGVSIFDTKTEEFSYLKNIPGNKNSIGGNHVLSVLADSDRNLWVGTWGEGVTLINRKNNTYKHFKNIPGDSSSLGSNNAWVIFEDSDKNIWVGTYWGGLNLYNKKTGTFKQFRFDRKLNRDISSDISSICEDKNGVLWIGTYNGGLEKFDKKTQTFTHYGHDENKNSISSDIVFYIYEGANNTLWLSTLSGLNHFNTETEEFTIYNTKNGLPHDLMRGITSDLDGNLWISTNVGLSKMDLKNKTFKNYIGSDGLKINEFTAGVLRSSTGHLYFGGGNGFIKFDPTSLDEYNFEPRLIFTDFQIFNEHVPILDSLHPDSPLKKHISETDSITLSYKHSVISFEFAAINYTVERKKQYAYRLIGFDEKWNNIGTKRTASYTNLDPGNYILQVKTLTNEGKWSSKMATIYISITPPFWKTWWFLIMSCILFLGSGFAIYWIRISSIKRQKEILEEQVEARTIELKKANDEIETLYSEIKDSIKAAEEIQEAILPEIKNVQQYLKDFFVFYKPKDIVSGDFYWFQEKNGKIVIAAIDCTGHGVSGALMSINGYYLLKLAISKIDELVASEILALLHEGVIKELNQNNYHLMSGMDISLCVIDQDKKTLQYAGAKIPLVVVREGSLLEFKGDKYSIGQDFNSKKLKFTNHIISLQSNDNIYMFSDGIADQFGGETGDEKFQYSRLRTLLKNIACDGNNNSVEILERSLKEWMGNTEQLDDILVLGFKI